MSIARPASLPGTVKWTGLAPVFFILTFLTACSTIPTAVSSYGVTATPLELTNTPFYPQQAYQCGPAALMTVLTASGVSTSLDALVEQVYLPARKGSLQSEMLAAARGAERVPYIIAPTLSSVIAELNAGRPVLILQNLSISWAPLWHYAVVIGVDPTRHEIYLRSGTDERRIMRTPVFLRTWRRSNYWAIVTLRPGELPANPDAARYAQAVAALEQTGHLETARAAWHAGINHWPEDTVPLFGLANVEYALGNFLDAEALYRQLLVQDESQLGARNNLAMTLLAQGRRSEALAEIDSALAAAADSPLRVDLLDTRLTIINAGSTGSQ